MGWHEFSWSQSWSQDEMPDDISSNITIKKLNFLYFLRAVSPELLPVNKQCLLSSFWQHNSYFPIPTKWSYYYSYQYTVKCAKGSSSGIPVFMLNYVLTYATLPIFLGLSTSKIQIKHLQSVQTLYFLYFFRSFWGCLELAASWTASTFTCFVFTWFHYSLLLI